MEKAPLKLTRSRTTDSKQSIEKSTFVHCTGNDYNVFKHPASIAEAEAHSVS